MSTNYLGRAIFEQVVAAKPALTPSQRLALDYREQSMADFGEAHRLGLKENPCKQCHGEGSCGYLPAYSANPDDSLEVGDCDECGATGSGDCPECHERVAYLTTGPHGGCRDCDLAAKQEDEQSDAEVFE